MNALRRNRTRDARAWQSFGTRRHGPLRHRHVVGAGAERAHHSRNRPARWERPGECSPNSFGAVESTRCGFWRAWLPTRTRSRARRWIAGPASSIRGMSAMPAAATFSIGHRSSGRRYRSGRPAGANMCGARHSRLWPARRCMTRRLTIGGFSMGSTLWSGMRSTIGI